MPNRSEHWSLTGDTWVRAVPTEGSPGVEILHVWTSYDAQPDALEQTTTTDSAKGGDDTVSKENES